MYNYPAFLNILSTGIYVPVSFAYIIPMQLWGNAISKEQTQIPKYKFAVMGALDCVASAMQIFAVNYISKASIIVLLQQSAIPISMIISKMFLKAEYTLAQYVGAMVVCSGIVTVLLPALSGASDDTGHNQVFWSFVSIISCIPMTMSSVYKEKALQGQDIDVVYLNGWVSVFQFLMCIPLLWPSALATDLPLRDLPSNLYYGACCLVDITPVYFSDRDDIPPEMCTMAPFYVTMYMMFNIAYNIIIIIILKYGSANIMYLGSTALVPLTNAAFALKWLPGHTAIKPTDLIGLIIIMAGIAMYRFFDSLVTMCQSTWRSKRRKLWSPKQPAQSSCTSCVPVRSNDTVLSRGALFVGINQADVLVPLIQTRLKNVTRTTPKLQRSPGNIRASYIHRLGLPPSPNIIRSLNGVSSHSPAPHSSVEVHPEARLQRADSYDPSASTC